MTVYSNIVKRLWHKGLNLLCEAAKKNGIKLLHDDIALDNPAISIFLKAGFIEEYRTENYYGQKEIRIDLNEVVWNQVIACNFQISGS